MEKINEIVSHINKVVGNPKNLKSDIEFLSSLNGEYHLLESLESAIYERKYEIKNELRILNQL